MLDDFTEGVLRALGRAEARAVHAASPRIEPIHLLAALADEDESRASSLLTGHGLTPGALLAAIGSRSLPAEDQTEVRTNRPPGRSGETRNILREAVSRARLANRTASAGTEHVLLALLVAIPPLADLLGDAGLRVAELLEDLSSSEESAADPIPLSVGLDPLELFTPADAAEIGRVLDASANRAREGLRVVEDYVRFVLEDPLLTKRLKDCRHRLDETVRGFDADMLIGSRDTTGDVGTHIMGPSEGVREHARAVLAANFKRCTEAIRSLEEYSKLLDAWISGRFEVLRYDLYTLEKLVFAAIAGHRSLDNVSLYVLVGGLPTLGDLTWIVGEALAGGAGAIQLREKGLSDREVLIRAREVRILTAQARARFFMNDRPDLARLSGADGVHLGQNDMAPRDARRVVGSRALLGISTHDRAQIEKATIDGAGYLGVGPVFESRTKGFDAHVGLGLVRVAAETTSLPWFAIGGIDDTTIDSVIEAGARRVAVGAAVVRAESPRKAAEELRSRLDSAG